MQKEQVIAALVMEHDGIQMKPQNLKRVKEDGVEYLKFRTVLQSLGVQNRNRRTYTIDTIRKGLQAEHVQELIREKSFQGEAGHPITQDVSRIMTVDPERASHVITSIEIVGNLVYGEVETLADINGPGTRFMGKIIQGMEPAFSLRAMAALTKRADGSAIANGRIHIVSYDQVILPSHKEAYRDKSTRIVKVTKGFEGECVRENGILIPLTEASIKDFIAMESENVKLISNFCEVAMESMELTPDMKKVILREGNETYHVKLEDRIRHEVLNYMANL